MLRKRLELGVAGMQVRWLVVCLATLLFGSTPPLSTAVAQSAASSVSEAPDAPSLASAGDPAQPALRTALEAYHRGDLSKVKSALSALLDGPPDSTPPSERRLALEIGADVMLKTDEPVRAKQWVIEATQMPDPSLDDWKLRLRVDERLGDGRDEAESIAFIYRHWGGNASVLTDGAIRSAVHDSDLPELSDVRLEMLLALYERRWRPANGSANTIWLELSRLLLASEDAARAEQVATLIDEPIAVISMHADRRYWPLFKSPYVPSNAKRVARDRLDALERKVRAQPRSLGALFDLLHQMEELRMDEEVVRRSTEVDRNMQQSEGRCI